VGMNKFFATERGNTLLVNGYQFAAWLELDENLHVEVTWNPSNYPALNVSTVPLTDEELADHINRKLQGWDIIKNNLPEGLINEDGESVAEVEYEEEEPTERIRPNLP
jgi:hypothetical protein